MITRIVKITLAPGKRNDFITLFNTVSPSIHAFTGCLEVEIMKDIQNENIAFTYSRWQSENDLENYRKSNLFEGTWSKAKLMFAQKAEAWSLENIKFAPNE